MRWDLLLCSLNIPFVKHNANTLQPFPDLFFFKSAEVPGILDLLRERLPEAVDQIVERAERICQHRFNLLGYEDIDYGEEIDWHVDAVHGKRASLRPWFRIPYLDFDQVGDSKVIWELSRHQHLITLAKAYRLTGEARYAQELLRQWYHWQEQNPYPFGINWASSLEVAFRSLSWLWVWYLLKTCSIVPDRFHADLQRALMLNARHIERYLSTYFSPNTHLLGEGVGLFFIGSLCSGSHSSQRWQKLGWQIVLQEAQHQVRPDGMHFEQSIYYHTYALDFFLHARILAGISGIPVPACLDEKIESMLDVLCAFGGTGSLPQFGDDDGGRVFDPGRNRREHLLDPLATGVVLFGRSDFKAVIQQIREETVWLLGHAGIRRFDQVECQPQTVCSFALPFSGACVMYSEKPTSQQLVIDAGPQGAGLAVHGHADALSLQLTVDGERLLIDPGTFVYSDGDYRNGFRGTGRHNTVQIDGLSQAEPLGPFKWRSLPKVNIDRWITNSTFDLFIGSHDGYKRLIEPVNHCRHVFHLKSHFWLVHDVLEGMGVHQLDLFWHLAEGTLSPVPSGATFVSKKQTELALLFAADKHYSQEIFQDCHSPVYGRLEPSNGIKVSCTAQLPASFATLIVPVGETNCSLGNFLPFEAEHTGVALRAYRYSTPGGLIHYVFFSRAPGKWRLGSWSSDARFLYCSIDNLSGPQHLAFCDGSHIELGARTLFAANSILPQGEWSSEECIDPSLRLDKTDSMSGSIVCQFD